MKKPGTRHKARKRAVDLLFEAEAKNVSPVDLVAERRELVRSDESIGVVAEYTERIVAGVTADGPQLDAVLTSHLREWTLPRLPAVDRAILRLAAWELFNTPDVPPVVVVDEAVELARNSPPTTRPRSSTVCSAAWCTWPRRSVPPPRRSRRARRTTHPTDRGSACPRRAARLRRAGCTSGPDIL